MLQNKRKRVEEEEEEEEVEEEELIENSTENFEDEEKKRREIRQKYLALISETESGKTEIIQSGSLKSMMEEGNKLFVNVNHAREGSLDALFLKKMGEFQVEKTSKIHVGQKFDENQFLEKIKIKYNKGQEIDWETFGSDVSKIFRKTPQTTFMYGPLKVEEKETKKREKRKKFKQGEAINPDEVNEVTKEKNETTKKVIEIFKKIKLEETTHKDEEIPFLNIAIDPNSFTQTIENIFHLGFLVKDGRLKLESKEDEEGMICSLAEEGEPTDIDKNQTSGPRNKQCILKLNLETWKRLKQ
jgi:non-structural maintenance of chromosomes element 4